MPSPPHFIKFNPSGVAHNSLTYPGELRYKTANRTKGVKINTQDPFTWASGWRSPLYCDNRKTLSYPGVRTEIKKGLCILIQDKFTEVEGIAGVATAGIPQGALVADSLGLPFIYVRSNPKSHGLKNLIEGEIVPGKNYVVVEDLVSTGGSSLKASADLQAAIISFVFWFLRNVS